MSAFNEAQHPRSRTGQFQEKYNTAPAGTLDFEDDEAGILVSAGREGALAAMAGEERPSAEAIFSQLVGREPEPADADDVAAFATQFATGYSLAQPSSHPVDVDALLSNYASARAEKIGRVNVDDADDDAYEEYENAVMDNIDAMFEALQRYRSKEKAELAEAVRPAKDIAVATVKRLAALDAARLTGQNAVTIAAAAVEADRAAQASAPTTKRETVQLDPQPWRSDASGMRYAQNPRDGHGPYRFLPRVGYAAERSEYR